LLLEGLADADPFRRWEATNALGSAPADGAVAALAAVLEGGSSDLRREAALSLGRIGDPAATPALLAALRGDPDPEVRWRAAMAVRWVGGAAECPELERLLAGEPEERVRDELRETLATLETAAGPAPTPAAPGAPQP
jgi:HEAT repeat protein